MAELPPVYLASDIEPFHTSNRVGIHHSPDTSPSTYTAEKEAEDSVPVRFLAPLFEVLKNHGYNAQFVSVMMQREKIALRKQPQPPEELFYYTAVIVSPISDSPFEPTKDISQILSQLDALQAKAFGDDGLNTCVMETVRAYRTSMGLDAASPIYVEQLQATPQKIRGKRISPPHARWYIAPKNETRKGIFDIVFLPQALADGLMKECASKETEKGFNMWAFDEAVNEGILEDRYATSERSRRE